MKLSKVLKVFRHWQITFNSETVAPVEGPSKKTGRVRGVVFTTEDEWRPFKPESVAPVWKYFREANLELNTAATRGLRRRHKIDLAATKGVYLGPGFRDRQEARYLVMCSFCQFPHYQRTTYPVG